MSIQSVTSKPTQSTQTVTQKNQMGTSEHEKESPDSVKRIRSIASRSLNTTQRCELPEASRSEVITDQNQDKTPSLNDYEFPQTPPPEQP